MRLPRYKLWHIFALTTVVALTLFCSRHLGVSLGVAPPCPELGNAVICGVWVHIQWDQKDVWEWHSETIAAPAPPAAVKDFCQKVGLFQ